eukprot:TRINITY_DN3189_c0_g1_i1.p1 TRINITY_DN3189_c0_g1~~TRINITY_DN3189_c0_g1_i1.p1  ORF type:complete len:851 (+),score=232.90 TRINITY_DN3189_c0_g1_i1:32-2554(+)
MSGNTDQTSLLPVYHASGSVQEEKNRPFCTSPKLLFSVAVLAAVAITFVLLGVLVWKKSSDSNVTPNRSNLFAFDDYFNKSMKPQFASVQWLPEQSAFIEQKQNNDIVKVDLPNLTPTVLASAADLTELGDITQYLASPDNKYLLLATDHQLVYRHSGLDVWWIYDVQAHTKVKLGHGQPLQYVQWNPNTNKHQIAFVRDNNLFISNAETPNDEITITTDGKNNQKINGLCDWLYEEEILAQSYAYWWSPDGNYVAYLIFELNDEPEYEFDEFYMPDNIEYRYKYPRPGQNNSIVTLGLYDVQAKTVSSPSIALYAEQYVSAVAWFGPHKLVTRILNRQQNAWILLMIDAISKETSTLSSEMHNQYFDPHQNALTYVPAFGLLNDSYVDLMVIDNQNHIVLFNAQNGEKIREVTWGSDWGVDEVVAYHQQHHVLYFIGWYGIPNYDRALYAVSLFDGMTPTLPKLLIPRPNPNYGTFQTVSFSDDANYFVMSEQADVPATYLMSVGEQGIKPTIIDTLRDNTAVLARLSLKALPKVEYFTFPGTIENTTLNGYIMYPADYVLPFSMEEASRRFRPLSFISESLSLSPSLTPDKRNNNVFPTLLSFYGGPGNQQVSRKYTPRYTDWHTYLVSTHRFIVMVMDGIGTGGKGDDFQKKFTFHQLGINEAKDVLRGVEFLRSLSFVDSDRIAIWGWSFGGFLSSMVSGDKDARANWIRATMSVAPVTDWRLYDSAYTERFMGTPATNLQGYEQTSLLPRAARFCRDGFHYLLVHGTGDDNVHFQNSAVWNDALVDVKAQYNEFFYTNRAHNLKHYKTGADNPHLYRMLTNFLLDKMEVDNSENL